MIWLLGGGSAYEPRVWSASEYGTTGKGAGSTYCLRKNFN